MTDAKPLKIQSDTVGEAADGVGVRMIQVFVPINGVMTPALVQATVLADANGVLLDDLPAYNVHLRILRELREIRVLLAQQAGQLVLDDDLPPRSGM